MSISSIVQNNQYAPQASNNPQQTMGKDDFMKLMLLQMRNQDPLEPMDNQAMLSQLAQFSSLEQMENLNSNFTNINNSESFMSATRLLGQNVEVQVANAAGNSYNIISSKVKSVNFTMQGPMLTLENGLTSSIEDIVKVSQPEN